MKRKIDEVIKAVNQELDRLYSEITDTTIKPDINIYMDIDYWHDCISELNGEVGPWAYEFYVDRTIRGFPVWRVIPFEKTHPPFVIVGKLVNKEEER